MNAGGGRFSGYSRSKRDGFGCPKLGPPVMAVTLTNLTTMSQVELDELFEHSRAGEIPDGDAIGTAIVAPGTQFEAPILALTRWFAWHGKVFHRAQGRLINKVGPLGIRLVEAKLYIAPSWFDGKPAI